MTRSKIFPGQRTSDLAVTLTDDIKTELAAIAMKYGQTSSGYVRSLLMTHLAKIKKGSNA